MVKWWTSRELNPATKAIKLCAQPWLAHFSSSLARFYRREKNFADYNRLSGTKDYLEALSADMGIPISAIVVSIKGVNVPLF